MNRLHRAISDFVQLVTLRGPAGVDDRRPVQAECVAPAISLSAPKWEAAAQPADRLHQAVADLASVITFARR